MVEEEKKFGVPEESEPSLKADEPKDTSSLERGIKEESPLKKAGLWFGAAFLGAVVGVVGGGLVASMLVPYLFGINPLAMLRGEYRTPAAEETIVQTGEGKTTVSEPVVAVARKVRPSVVNIRTKQILSDVFHEGVYARGIGSGVIFRKDGYILTNNHVVEGAEEIWVTIGESQDIQGRVVGRDPEIDIAVVKVNKTGLTAARLGSSSGAKVGETVIAMGSPYGFEYTVTSGVVSALHRTVTAEDQGTPRTLTDLIQTDAAINPGNSGGALCNLKGEVIGINTLIYSQTGGYQGIGFAIPVEIAIDAANQLIKTGKVSHPYIGVLGQTVDEEVARERKLPVKEGALLVRVYPNTPADKAGLKVGDVVTEADGKEISTMEDFIAAIRSHEVGEKMAVTYLRGSKRKTARVTLAEKPRLLPR